MDHLPTSRQRRTHRRPGLYRVTYARSTPWRGVPASASAWLTPLWCERRSPTFWERPVRRVLMRPIASQHFRHWKQSP